MPTWRYALERGGDKSLAISCGAFWNNFEVRLNGNLIGAIPSKKELKTGRIFQLPDGTALRVQLVNNELRVLRNDKPVPGSSSDPAAIIYTIAGLNIILGFIALILQMAGIRYIGSDPEHMTDVNFLQTLGFVWYSPLVIGIIFLVLGFFTQRRSLIALIITVIIYCLEIVSVLFSAFNLLFSAFITVLFSASNIWVFVNRIASIIYPESYLIGFLVAWIYFSINILRGMERDVVAINELKKKTSPTALANSHISLRFGGAKWIPNQKADF